MINSLTVDGIDLATRHELPGTMSNCEEESRLVSHGVKDAISAVNQLTNLAAGGFAFWGERKGFGHCLQSLNRGLQLLPPPYGIQWGIDMDTCNNLAEVRSGAF